MLTLDKRMNFSGLAALSIREVNRISRQWGTVRLKELPRNGVTLSSVSPGSGTSHQPGRKTSRVCAREARGGPQSDLLCRRSLNCTRRW